MTTDTNYMTDYYTNGCEHALDDLKVWFSEDSYPAEILSRLLLKHLKKATTVKAQNPYKAFEKGYVNYAKDVIRSFEKENILLEHQSELQNFINRTGGNHIRDAYTASYLY